MVPKIWLVAPFQVGDYVPRRWSSRLWLAPPALPAALARLLAYAFSVSAAVALLNAAPIVLLVRATLSCSHGLKPQVIGMFHFQHAPSALQLTTWAALVCCLRRQPGTALHLEPVL